MRVLRYISLEALLLGLDDLLSKRHSALKAFANGAANEGLLKARRDKIKALPAAARGLPLADELAAADGRHDGAGAAIWFMIEAYLRHPDTTPERLEAAKRIRAAVIPSLEELGFTYEVEVNAAKGRKVELPNLKADLDLFPVAGGTLHDWASTFIAAGEKIDVLLSQRADKEDRAAASALRSETIGLLNRLRKSLQAEAKEDASLPASLDGDVFGYFDLLEGKAADAAAEERKKKAAAKGDKGDAEATGGGSPEGK